jgi:hypothetical protein
MLEVTSLSPKLVFMRHISPPQNKQIGFGFSALRDDFSIMFIVLMNIFRSMIMICFLMCHSVIFCRAVLPAFIFSLVNNVQSPFSSYMIYVNLLSLPSYPRFMHVMRPRYLGQLTIVLYT